MLSAEFMRYNDKEWVVCPFCGKKNFEIGLDTTILNLEYKCKASYCKQKFMINTEGGHVVFKKY